MIMLDIAPKQGKHRNPVTGSGSSLLGVVEKMGEAFQGKINLKVSDKFPTLELSPLTQLLH